MSMIGRGVRRWSKIGDSEVGVGVYRYWNHDYKII